MRPDQTSSSEHSDACGIAWATSCRDCQRAWETLKAPPGDETDAAEKLKLALGLPRRPQTMNAAERLEILMRLADLERTTRKVPEFGVAMRSFLGSIMGLSR